MAARRKPLGLIIAATISLAFGSWLLLKGHYAQTYQTVIPGGGQKAPWMYPWQAYVSAGLCFAAAAYALVSAFVTKDGEHR
jgi:hypothetical protein